MEVIAHVDARIDYAGNVRKMEEVKCIGIEYFEKPYEFITSR